MRKVDVEEMGLLEDEMDRCAALLSKVAFSLSPEMNTAVNQLTRSRAGVQTLVSYIGAKNFKEGVEDGNPFVAFRHMPAGKYADLKVNAGMTKITYNLGLDLYTLTFYTTQGRKIKEFDQVYGDDLTRIFEKQVALFFR